MKKFLHRIFRSLYWRISYMLLGILSLLTLGYLLLALDTVKMYSMETNQKLNYDVAAHIAQDTPLFQNGQLNQEVAEHTFHNVMVLNPSLEVYLLDTKGKILAFFAPKSKIKLQQLPLEPIQQFIADSNRSFRMGEDPRHPGVYKAFSAAAVKEGEALAGYIYVILGSEEHEGVSQMVASSYWLRIATRSAAWLFAGVFLISLLLLYFLTRNFRKIAAVVKRFQQGDHTARIRLRGRGEISQLADHFDEMADTIVHQIQEIRSVEKLRRELIANVSHDLRTPLAAIQGYAETLVLKQETLNEQQKLRYTQIILKSTERIKGLVEQLFEFSKLESKQVKIAPEYFNLQELVHDVVAKYELEAQQKAVKLSTTIPTEVPPIYADIALIDRVLQNLLDNALRHTPPGGEINIEMHPKGDSLHVRVADTGLGIPEGELPYIFERYRKGASNKEGNGLGLAIVKKILEMHQTAIEVESAINRGTAFYFQLPLAKQLVSA